MTRLPFEEDDEDLALLPMAARRALDRAGLKLSLAAWRSLPRTARERLVTLGAAADVDVVAVAAACVDALPAPVAIEPLADPIAAPAGVDEALWAGLSALERYALDSYARRGKTERLARALITIRS